MRFCTTDYISDKTLARVDEIKVDYVAIKKVYGYLEEYPNADIILVLPQSKYAIIDWIEIGALNDMSHGKLVLAMQDLAPIAKHRIDGLRWYYNYPVESWYDANALATLGSEYIIAGVPLFFNMTKLAELGMKIRIAPNIAYVPNIPRENGICGQWVRPEDLHLYEQYNVTVEFFTDDPIKEETLFKVYHDDKVWPGNLNLLIDHLNYDCDNRGVHEDIGWIRLTCGHHCQSGTCHLCHSALALANAADEYRKQKEKN